MTEPQKIPLVEKQMIQTAIWTFIVLVVIEIIAYYVVFKNIPDFLGKYGYYLALLVIAVVVNAIAVWHIKAYKRVMPCMTGMMLGMTIGMASSLSLSMVVGAVNGMFIGSLVGVILGMGLGAWIGNCCGVMGVMEGMMAGLMGGTMGPMISLMALQFAPHLITVVLISIIFILFGLVYMLYQEEKVLEERTPYQGYSFIPFSAACIILTLILTFIMVYGPKFSFLLIK